MTATLSMPPPEVRDHSGAAGDVELLARIVGGGDDQAFALLVQRHGPMVLGVCRRVLGNHHDAEDAFQATFLLLARQAGSIHHPERLASWLYGVAHRTALKLRKNLHTRQEAERKVAASGPLSAPPLELAWREVQQALDEEISRLDSKLRGPLILCYLEGKSQEEAARALGRPLGSMSWLLSRALTALRGRLASRGMTLTGGMSSLLLALQSPFPVSEQLVANTLRSLGVLGTASPIVGLVNAVLRDLVAERSSRLVQTFVVALLLLLGTAGAGYATLSAGHARPTPDSRAERAPGTGCKKCKATKAAGQPRPAQNR